MTRHVENTQGQVVSATPTPLRSATVIHNVHKKPRSHALTQLDRQRHPANAAGASGATRTRVANTLGQEHSATLTMQSHVTAIPIAQASRRQHLHLHRHHRRRLQLHRQLPLAPFVAFGMVGSAHIRQNLRHLQAGSSAFPALP